MVHGAVTATTDTLKSMGLSRAASTLGAAVVLGEIDRRSLNDADIGSRWDLWSGRTSSSAGIELLGHEIIVLGMSSAWSGPLAVDHAVMMDAIDIEPVRDDYPSHPRITYLGGRSSTDPEVVAEVRGRARGKRTLVVLDSDHSQAHVEAELAAYADLVPVGCYLIVEDSNIGQIRKDLMPGPLQAVEAFLARTDEFVVDREREKFLITFNPSGYLRRVR